MKRDEIIEKLVDFGLTEKESSIYLYLLSHGTSKARDISRLMELKRGNTYQLLSSLQEKGFVAASLDVPVTYSAVEPDKALTNIIVGQENTSIRLKKLCAVLIGDLVAYYEPNVNDADNQFMILPDQKSVYGQILKMLQESEGEMIIVTTIVDLANMYYTAIPEMIKKMEPRLIVKVITEINSQQEIEYIKRLNVKYARYAVLPTKARLVCSKRQVIHSNTSDQSGTKNIGFLTNSPYAVENTDYMCNELWKNAQDIPIEQKEHELSKKPRTPIITKPKNEHLLLLYEDENELAKKVIRFLKFGIVYNYLCILVVGKQEESLFLKSMRENNLDPQHLISSGRLFLLPFEKITQGKDALSDKSLNAILQELAQKVEQQNMLGLNIVGMLANRLLSDGYVDSSIKLEQSWDKVISESKIPIRVLCPHKSIGSDNLVEMVKCHSHQLLS